MDPNRFELATITHRTDWDTGLFSITLDCARSFVAGQYALLARDPDTPGERTIQRAYSIASAPDKPLEFYIVEVEGGAITPSLYAKRVGDSVWVGKRTTGRFQLDRVPSAPTLWWLATGTGLAPFLSMLRHGEGLDRFDSIVLVHGVRTAGQLAYADELARYAASGRLRYVPMTTRDPGAQGLHGRIPAKLADGSLEAACGRELDPARDQVMLCGNPAMIDDLSEQLGARGMNERLHFERYW